MIWFILLAAITRCGEGFRFWWLSSFRWLVCCIYALRLIIIYSSWVRASAECAIVEGIEYAPTLSEAIVVGAMEAEVIISSGLSLVSCLHGVCKSALSFAGES